MNQRYNVALLSLGCDKNLVDSEITLGFLDKDKYTISNNLEDSEIIIINTCGFIESAKEESINKILKYADYKKTSVLKSLIVVGCLSQRYKEELLSEIPEIDGMLGTNEYDKINEVINKSLRGEKPLIISDSLFDYEDNLSRIRLTPNHYAYIKIAEGCNNLCTFCAIPAIRGKYRSRSIESIIKEAKEVVSKGAKELIIVAEDTSLYGVDRYNRKMLPELVSELSNINDLAWIRIHYLYPENISEEIIEMFNNNPKLCNYIDFPIQHSEDKILKKMNRPFYKKDILELITKIRKNIPNVALRTSIIVGFPGESEEDFNNLVNFVEEVKFDRLGVFPYSDEEGTAAFKLPAKIDDETKEKRSEILMNIQREISNQIISNNIGKEFEVLIDEFDNENNTYIGRTRFDSYDIDGLVYVSDIKGKIGDIVTAKITHSYDFDLVGKGVQNEFTK